MKKIFVRGLVVGLGAMLYAGWGSEASAQGESHNAMVLRLQGKARASSDHVQWHKLENGSVIMPGTLIQTGANSMVDIGLATTDKQDSETVRILADSVLGIDRLSSQRVGDDLVEDIELDLQAGQVTGVAGKPAGASKYEVKFASGIVGIRGAKYQMTASGIVTVFAGEAVVALAAADGSTAVKAVTAGSRFDPTTGLVSDASSAPAPMPTPAPMPAMQPKMDQPTVSTNAPEFQEVKPPTMLHPLRKF
jgi:hypothetical protein